VPSLNNSLVNRVFVIQNEVCAFGILKLFAELHLNLDPSLSSYMKARIISEGVSLGIEKAIEKNLERVHAIVDDSREIEILKKHFGFVKVDGTLLVKEI